jgi:hypothetical protein
LKTTRLILTLTLICSGLLFAGNIKIPGDGFAEGWKKSGNADKYYKNDLYGHIDGGAELFLEFGFDSLLVQDYAHGDREISLEVYVMEIPASALGIYLMKCGKEMPSQSLKIRNSINPYQVIAVNGNCYVQVNNFSGDTLSVSAMEDLVNNLFSTSEIYVGDGLFELLPPDGLVPGSEKLVRGQYALQPFYTFGEGDVFQLNGKIFGVTAVYQTEDGDKFSRLVIRYQDHETAENAFKHLINNLDTYLSVIETTGNQLVFKDYQNKYGQVVLAGNELRAAVHLPGKPGL